jgi:hypothetical protein
MERCLKLLDCSDVRRLPNVGLENVDLNSKRLSEDGFCSLYSSLLSPYSYYLFIRILYLLKDTSYFVICVTAVFLSLFFHLCFL